jgi:hypothetical protein
MGAIHSACDRIPQPWESVFARQALNPRFFVCAQRHSREGGNPEYRDARRNSRLGVSNAVGIEGD